MVGPSIHSGGHKGGQLDETGPLFPDTDVLKTSKGVVATWYNLAEHHIQAEYTDEKSSGDVYVYIEAMVGDTSQRSPNIRLRGMQDHDHLMHLFRSGVTYADSPRILLPP